MINQLSLVKDQALADADARLAAIDPSRSFIVQAPAGSGKTALLTQRFLALLTRVDSPEQIVAMTFTKKAAAEMRERVFAALKTGLLEKCNSDKPYDLNTWNLARKVLERDQQQAWCLLENPNRLRIRTIDSMNGYLVQQMPFLSKLGTQPALTDNNDALYIEAVRAVLRSDAVQTETAALLSLVNGRYARAETLLVSMLKKRDQWMRLLWSSSGRESLEQALAALVQAELRQALMKVDAVLTLGEEWSQLAVFALSNKPDLPVAALAKGQWPLEPQVENLALFRELAAFVLTADGKKVRAKVDARQGFPAGKDPINKQNKERMQGLLSELSLLSPASIQALDSIRNLPDPCYSDSQWLDLSHVITLLKHAVAHLTLVFKTAGQTDFIEVAQAASQALGDEDQPTDLALQLDYQIQHLLIDEFQDTSAGQFELVKKLLRGWLPDDGRTLFIVGDPMQSIYRFREAEVGNFLQVWQNQALPIGLTPLSLKVNFRSCASLVDWFNQTFSRALPRKDDLVLGAVKYAEAQASPQAQADQQTEQQAPQNAATALPSVVCHWGLNVSPQQEAEQICQQIQTRLSQLSDPKQQIVVLGRSRSHLAGLAYHLKQQGVAFRAVELEVLNERQEIQDCLALSRALLHGADRGAWLALLRAPFIGLSLADLYYLCGEDTTRRYAPVPQLLANQAWSRLSEEGQQRLQQAWSILEPTLALIGSQPFSRVVHQAWWSLGAAQALDTQVELDNVQVFFDGLAQWDGEILTQQALDEWVQKLYAAGDSSSEAQRVQLMTMHKSKGLQFDTVILPSLAKQTGRDDRALVSWLEFATEQGEGLVLAPLDQKGQANSPLNKLISRVEQQKQSYEDARLLYVAATRAERQLHLFGSLKVSAKHLEQDKPLQPAPNSLLQTLWPQVAADFEALVDPTLADLNAQSADKEDAAVLVPKVKRLPLRALNPQQWRDAAPISWSNASLVSSSRFAVTTTAEQEGDAADTQSALSLTASVTARRVGDLVHALLEQVVWQGVDQWTPERCIRDKPIYAHWLSQQGVPKSALDDAVERVLRSLEQALRHPKMRWALANDFAESATELALTSRFDPSANEENHIVDRTFVDEQGVRWIIDYKTSALRSSDPEAYLAQLVAQYQPQLARYGALFDAMEQRPQRWVLFFTELNQWVELPQDRTTT